MDVSEQALRRFWAGGPLDESWPLSFHDKTDAQITAYLQEITDALGRSDLLNVQAEFDPFGNNGTSFVEAFCFKKDGSTQRRYGTGTITTGIMVYLSKMAPVCIFGHVSRTIHNFGGSSPTLSADDAGSLPAGDWHAEGQEIRDKMAAYHFFVLDRAKLSESVPFAIDNHRPEADSNLREGPVRIFDLFFWFID